MIKCDSKWLFNSKFKKNPKLDLLNSVFVSDQEWYSLSIVESNKAEIYLYLFS